jgi:hypothetical protein
VDAQIDDGLLRPAGAEQGGGENEHESAVHGIS